MDLAPLTKRLLVVNVGSSSLKLSLVEGDRALETDELELSDGALDEEAVSRAVAARGRIDAVCHRIVHGGEELVEPVVIDAEVRARLEALVDLAPLHLPKSLAGIDLFRRLLPEVPAIGCFDTAFHAGLPPEAATYALPAEWRRRWSLKRYGFHGLSHSYASRRAGELAGEDLDKARIVTCHLGAGASLAAVTGGRSVDTTMGFTPLEGLVMATRSGSVDPGLILWLEEHVGMKPSELATSLEERSGLLGLAGEKDMRRLLRKEEEGDEEAHLAVGVYLHRLRAAVASMTASLGGLDLLVFTGGVGENSAAIRLRTCQDLGFLGVALDPGRNAEAEPDCEISADRARVRSFVVAAREDLEIARQASALV